MGRTPTLAEQAAVRELAALVDGPRTLRWFWRDDLENMQAAARRAPRWLSPCSSWRWCPGRRSRSRSDAMRPGRRPRDEHAGMQRAPAPAAAGESG